MMPSGRGKFPWQLWIKQLLPGGTSQPSLMPLGVGFPRAALIGVMVALVVVLSLAACGNGTETQDAAQPTQYLRPMPTSTAYPTATPYPTSTPYPTPTPLPAGKETCETTMTESAGTATSEDELPGPELFALISPSVAFIESEGGLGSGLLVDGGCIVTNYHVVWPSSAVRVVFPDGTELEEVPVVGWDPMADLAVLGPVDVSAQPLRLVNGEGTPVGSELFLIGYQDEVDHLFPQPTITRGILSNLREWEWGGITYLQTDHRVAGGQSGGALVNSRGEVIGLPTFYFGEAQNGLSASSADIGPILVKLTQGAFSPELGDRRLPAGDGKNLFEIELRNLWDTREFVFEPAEGTTVDIVIEGDGDGRSRVFDSFGLLLEVDDGYTGIESAEVEITTSGVHFLQVDLASGGEPSAFSVTSSVMLKPLEDPDDGRSIMTGDTTAAGLDFPGDWDWYSISLEEGDTVRVYADSLNVDTLLYVGPSESEYQDFVLDDDSGGGLFGLNSEIVYRAPHTGEYFVVVSEAVGDANGGYYLSVETAPVDTPLTENSPLNQDSMSAESEKLINDFYDCLTTNDSLRQSLVAEILEALQESGMTRDEARAVAESYIDDRELILSILRLGIKAGAASEFRDELSENCDWADPSSQHTPATASPAQVSHALLDYADRHAHGPGAIYVGDIKQLVGPAPTVEQGDFGGNVPLESLERHRWLYESPFYRELLEKANLTDPTPMTYDGPTITIQHVCINRALLPCRLMESYLAPNLEERTSGKLKFTTSSFPQLGLSGPDTLNLVKDGALDSVTVYAGYVGGEIPAIEIQSLWGIYSSHQQQFEATQAIIKDIEELVLAETGGGVLSHNWYAGNDQFLFCRERIDTLDRLTGKEIRSHSATLSDWIVGMGAEAKFLVFSEVYTAIERGILDCGVTRADAGYGQRWYEVTDYLIGPLLSFPSNNNVINAEKWASIPEDLQRIILEEAARSELEALRVAAIQNEIGLIKNTTERWAGQDAMVVVPFSDEMNRRSNTVAMEQVVQHWASRIGDTSHPIIADTFNRKLGPIVGLRIQADGTVVRVPRASAPDDTVNRDRSVKQWSSPPPLTIDPESSYTAVLNTSEGEIAVELLPGEAPHTVNNFVFLARQGFYDGLIFHRTVEGFIIQGGDPTGTGAGGPGYQFSDEQVRRPYTRGVMAMANAGPNTNGSQFFIMHADHPLAPNYTIFGQTVSGLETIDAIATAPTEPGGEGSTPVNPVVIHSVKIIGPSRDAEEELTATPVSESLLSNLAKQAEKGLVEITAYKPGVNHFTSGIGFIFATAGSTAFVVTYGPLIEFEGETANPIEVRVNRANTYRATLLGYDSDGYFGVMSICCDDNFAALELETSGSPRVGTQVIAVGYPEYLSRAASGCDVRSCATAIAGVIQSTDPDWLGESSRPGFFTHDARLYSDYFGGPLFSTVGKVWGVNVGLTGPEGNFYTVPYWTINELLSSQTGRDPAPTFTGTADYDADNDGLIEISNLEQLDSMRYDLDGDGVATDPEYATAFPNALTGMGCPSSGCTGYELAANLDFDTNSNGLADDGDSFWNDGAGWVPLGDRDRKFTANFDGNGNTIANLYIDRDITDAGLFGYADYQSRIWHIGLTAVDVSNTSDNNVGSTGSLVGLNQGEVRASYATGSVLGSANVGGLVGANVGIVDASYADVSVTGEGLNNYYTGGLVGQNAPDAVIALSYAAGRVTAQGDHTGGLVGGSNGGGGIVASYATGSVSGGSSDTGGLVGNSWYTTIVNSYATGSVSSTIGQGGGLVGEKTDGEVRDSYWNVQTSGKADSAGGKGKTTRELQSPTSNTGLYANWEADRWDFGTSRQYPALIYPGMSLAAQRR